MKLPKPSNGLPSSIVFGSQLLSLASVLFVSSQLAAAQCQMTRCTILGTAANDFLVGTTGDDVICGLDGDDKLIGGGGNDLICGGNGDDRILGGSGMNTLVGGLGDDSIRSVSESDVIFGNQGRNRIQTRFESTQIVFGSGDEEIVKKGKHFSKPTSRWNLATSLPEDEKGNLDKLRESSGSKLTVLQGRAANETVVSRNVAEASDKPFTTENNRVYSPDGSEFIPKGVNIFPWALGDHNVDGILDCWKFNMVRLHSWILPSMTTPWKDHLVYVDEPLLFDDSEERFRTYDIAPLIDTYTSQGIVVVIDIHDLIGGYFTGQNLAMYLRFVEDVASKYADNPYVWLDVHNEPGSWEGLSGDFTEWRTQMPLVLDTVRAVAPNMVLLVSGTAWGQDSGPSWWDGDVAAEQSALLSNTDIIQGYDNLIVTFHMYDQWKFSYDRVKNFVDKLLYISDAPILVGEYGSWNGSSTLPASQYLHALVNEAGYEHVGRSVWTWSAWDDNDLVAGGDGSGYLVDSCEAPSNLSGLGRLVWDDNHSVN